MRYQSKRQRPLSIFMLLLCLVAGLAVGRWVFPQVDAAKLAARQRELVNHEMAARKSNPGKLVASLGKVLSAPEGTWNEAGIAAANSGPASLERDAKLFVLGEVMKLPGVQSPWRSFSEMSEKLRTTIARALPAYADLTTLRAKFEKQQDAREREKLAGELAFAWAEYSPRNALTWLESLKAPAEKTAATSTFMKAWCEGDPVEAEQWLVTLDSGPQRDAAVVAYLSSIKFLDTVTAITWAASIDEGSLREAAVQAVVKAVRTPDEALDAAEAMNTVGKLPDAERTKWVDQLTSLATKPSTPP